MLQAQADKDMEEILSSIRQIIAEDVEGNAKSSSPKLFIAPSLEAGEGEQSPLLETDPQDILELTNMLPEDPYKGPQERKALQSSSYSPALPLDHQLSAAMEKAFPTEHSEESSQKESSLLSEAVTGEVSRSFKVLSEKIKQVGTQEGSLSEKVSEEMVRESLTPLLKEWLEDNLPRLVKEVVSEEIQKVIKKSF